MKYNVFISYCRQGGFEVAKLIKEYLARNGNFPTELLDRIADCEDFILILYKNVFDATIKNNKKKEDGDWLRTELAETVNKRKNVIPSHYAHGIREISGRAAFRYCCCKI